MFAATWREPIDRKCRSNADQSALDGNARNENISDEFGRPAERNARWVNCKGKWLSLPAALKASASQRQNFSRVRVLMFLLLAAAKRDLKKPWRRSAATSRAFKATSRTCPTSIVS